MCGIAAIFAHNSKAPPVDPDELCAVGDRMIARGPDGAGSWISTDGRIGFSHRRLAIIDLSDAGAQPMFTPDGLIGVTFNGEIYNHKALRSHLKSRGYQFRSHCDTEVLLYLYLEKGLEMVHDLRGMFAFAIWDSRKRGLLLVRDPFGIKPLYYADNGLSIRAASQIKALLQSENVDSSAEAAGHVGFFLWGHLPDPFTLFRGIRALPAGHLLWVDEAHGNTQPREYCSIRAILADTAPNSTATSEEALRGALTDSVEQHLVADVPVGIFLSSGLDSCTLAALAAEKHSHIRTVTLGFHEFRGTSSDEVPLAEKMALHAGAQHQTIWVSRVDFESEYENLFEAMDRPSVDGVNTYFVSMAARRAGLKVALSGLGGDELFGGYSGFQQIPRLVGAIRRIPLPMAGRRAFRRVSASILKHFTSPKYAGLLEYGQQYSGAYLLRRGLFMPWELPDLLDPDLVRSGWETLQPLLRLDETTLGVKSPHARVSALELHWYMRNQLLYDADWSSMCHSLEIRLPFVDIELLRILAPFISGSKPPTKQDLARSPRIELPPAILGRPKSGFKVPISDWLTQASKYTLNAEGCGQRGLRKWAHVVYSNFSGEACRSARRTRQSNSRPAI